MFIYNQDNRTLFFLFLTLFYSFCDSKEYVSISQSILQRTQQYPLGKYKKVVVCTPARCGGTLITNILLFLFEDISNIYDLKTNVQNRKIEKTHRLSISHPNITSLDNICLVSATRNPVDACYSLYHFLSPKRNIFQSENDFLNDLVKRWLFQYYNCFSYSYRIKDFMVLDYNCFENNFDYFFEKIEKFFYINIDPLDKDLIRQIYSTENVILHTKTFSKVSKLDSATHFHYNHINPDILPIEEKNRIKTKISQKINEIKLF